MLGGPIQILLPMAVRNGFCGYKLQHLLSHLCLRLRGGGEPLFDVLRSPLIRSSPCQDFVPVYFNIIIAILQFIVRACIESFSFLVREMSRTPLVPLASILTAQL